MIRILCFLLLCSLFLPASHLQASEKKWTFMVYLNGDNTLDQAGIGDVREMQKIGSSDQVDIVVLQDHDSNNDTERHFVKKDELVTEQMGEIDMGDWHEALKFFQWGVENHPAEHYCFLIWNHGTGWRGRAPQPVKNVSYDDQSGNCISTVQLKALTEAMKAVIGRRIDVFGFDACLMGMIEVAWEMKDNLEQLIFSEEVSPNDGWPYNDILGALVDKPEMTPLEFSVMAVEKYRASYSGGSQGDSASTLSAVNCVRFDSFSAEFNEYLDFLSTKPDFYDDYLTAFTGTQQFYFPEYKDLPDLVKLIGETVNDADIKEKSNRIFKSLVNLNPVIAASGSTGKNLAAAKGLSIFVPKKAQYDSLRKPYLSLDFSKENRWDEFLDKLYYPQYPSLSIKSIEFSDGNDDGIVSPGESIDLKVTVQNQGLSQAANAVLTLSTDNPLIRIECQTAVLAEIPGSGEAVQEGLKFTVNSDSPLKQSLEVTISVTLDGKTSSQLFSMMIKSQFEVKNRVLLVTENINDRYSAYYVEALQSAGIGYDVWNVRTDGKPSAGLLKHYLGGMVIYFAPLGSYVADMDPQSLKAFLAAGGSLFLSGQDFAEKWKKLDIYTSYLHASCSQSECESRTISGCGDFTGLEFNISGAGGADNQSHPDEIEALAPAKLCLNYKGAGGAGLFVNTGNYRIVYLGFGFEAIASKEARLSIMNQIVKLLMPGAKERIEEMFLIEKQLATAPDDSSRFKLGDQLNLKINLTEKTLIGESGAGTPAKLSEKQNSVALKTVLDSVSQFQRSGM
ncbi:MAG: clostripain-related cysteine peptidase [Candidatus Wallbacteria bacterium]|nr:clostripain-related cysteine peptidase [Candidatus Wallbacteria bacterium]